MKAILAVFLVLPTVLAAAAEPAAEQAASKPDAGLSPLARKYAAKRAALLKKYAAKRNAMIESSGWKSLSPQEQQSRLDALVAETQKRDQRLAAAEDVERRRDASRDADAAVADQARRRRMSDIQAQAAQSRR